MERKCRLMVIGIWICLGLPLIVSEATAQIHISKSSLTIEEGGKGSYKLHLDTPPSAEITLDITTTNSDVRVKPESLTFTPDDWGKARKITVEAIRDADAEDDRAIISHSVRTASNRRKVSANLQAATATARSNLTVIVLDRFVPSHEVNISPSSGLSIRKGGSGNYSVSLTERPTASVTVRASSSRSDVTVSPSSRTFYVGTWNSTQSFTVSVDADATSSSATISHSATSEDVNYQGLTIDSLPVTVLQPPAGITQPPSQTRVLVGQTKTYYSPALRSQPTGTVTIDASSQATGTATATDSKSFGSGNWNTAQDFKVSGQSPGTATITYDVDSSDSRYDGFRLSSTSVTVEATTITCRADDTNIQLGGSSTLSWDSTNANSVTINQGVGSVPVDSPDEGKTVTPPQPGAAETSKTTTYRFTAAGGGNPGTCSVTVTVWRPPSVDRFSADPAALRKGQTTSLIWATSHASGTSIDQGIGTVPVDSSEGGPSVTPPQPSSAGTSKSTSYTLTASNPAYSGADAATATVSVTVWNRPSVDSFTASPSTIDEGEDSSLKWTTTHATNASIDQGVGSVSVDDESGNTKVSPNQGTTYTLTASNPGYSGARAATDTVRVSVTSRASSPGLSVSPTTLNITEGATGESYNVRLKTRPSGDVTVAVGIESGGDSRVQKNTSSLTFTTTDWNRDQAVQVFAEEQSGTATGQARITNTPPLSYGGSAVGVTVNVADDDTDGCGTTVTPTGLTIDEGESNDGYYDVVLATSPAASVTITLDLTGDPSLSVDESSLTFTTANWHISQRVTIEAGEDEDASDGRGTIAHMASSTDEGCSGISISSVSVNIRDNDEPPPLPAITLSSDGTSVSEPDGTVTVTAAVASGEEPADDLTINLTHSGQAANGTDYTVATLTIESGATSGEAELTVFDDPFFEGTEEIRLIAGANGYRDSAPLSMNLTDDDSVGVRVTPNSLTIPEGGRLAYKVRLTSQPARDVTITITHSGDGDIGIDDEELIFSDSDWERAQTVMVTASHDADAINDTATLSHTVASADGDYSGITVSEVGVTVTDDETAGVSILPEELTIAEGGSETYQVVLTSRPSHDVTVTVSRSGDQDIGIDNQQLTFTNSDWNQEKLVTVTAAQDADPVNDTATLSHAVASADADYNGIRVAEVDVTVTDDETAGVSILPGELTIAEGGSDTYRVVLTSQPAADVTVTISRSGDRDISIDDQELTFTGSDWDQEKTVSVMAAHDDDAIDDTAAFSHTVESADADYNGIAVSEVDVTVTDDEMAGVSILPTELTIAEGGSDTYQVVLTSKPSHEVTVTINHGGDNDIDSDPDRLTFSPSNWNQEKTVTVTSAQDDDAIDDTAAFSHTVVSADTDYNGITVSEVAVTVTDDEMAGVSILPTELSIAEGGSDSYEVVLTSQPTHDVTVRITHRGDGDIGIDDQELTFTGSDWDQEKTVTVTSAHDDDAIDDTATFSHSVASTDAGYNGIAVSEVAIAVTDDETAGVSITPRQLTIAEGGSDSYEVVLTSQPTHDVTVRITHSGDGDIGIDDQELTFTGSDWDQEKTVTVTSAHDDDAIDDTATFSHTVESTDAGYKGIAVSEVAVTVTDDETAGVSITPTELTIAEGGSDSYQVVLTSQPAHDVTITITHIGDGDIGIDDQELTFTDSDWQTAQAVTVTADHDADAINDAATLSHTISSTDAGYNGITVSEVAVTVTDDEMAGVSILPTELSIAEGGGDSYQVVLTSQPAHDVTITITHIGDGDIGIDDQELTFTDSDWQTAQAVTVTADHDADAINDAATLSHAISSTDGDYNGIAVPEVAVTVTDDETAGVSITPTDLTIAEGGSDTYQVVLTSQPTHDVTVRITHSGDGDIGIDDQELTFTGSGWKTPQTVAVTAAQDDDAIDDTAIFSHTVFSTDTDYNGIAVPEVAVAVTDDETARVSILPAKLTIAEGASDSYQVVLTSQPAHDVTITITHSGDPDIGIEAGSLTFTGANWKQLQTVTVEASPDDDAVDDSAKLAHSAASSDGSYNGLILRDVRISVKDDDSAGVGITPTNLSIPEGASTTYNVVLTSKPSDAVILAVSSDNGDLTPVPASLTFIPRDWNAPQTVRARAAQDDDAQDDKARFSHAAASADPTYHGIPVDEVGITVSDNDSAGVKVAPTRLAIPEDASTTYTVALTSRPSRPVVVALSHSGDPDISANVAQVIFEPSEWDNPGTVTVQASRDADAVDDTATLRHSASSSDSTYDGVPVDPVRITVGDLDSVGVNITPLNLTIDEGASRTYTVVLTSKPSQDVVVEVDRSGDEDVVSQPDSLTFTGSNWQDPQAVTVQALQDPDAVDDTATLLHSTTSSDAAYGGLTVPGVSVSVIDDDTTGVNVSPLELAVLEGTSETCTVALASKPSAEVHISLNSNNNDVSPSPASLTFSPMTWSTAQEVMVPVAQDEDATDEVATLTFSATSPDPAYHGISVPAVSVDINDDDNAGVKIVPNPHMSVPEGESATYTMVLLSQPLATVAVAISSSNPQMLTAAFDEVTFTQDNWSVAQTVAFDTFHDDNTLDENEVLSHSAVSLDPNYKGISVTPLLVTITDRTAEKLTRTLPVLLSAMSGALAESIQTAVESRFERRRQMQRMKQDQGWWMPSYYQDRSRLSPEFNPSGGPETEPILSRASFGLPLAGNAFGGTHWRPVLWGHGDFQHFNGTSSLVDFRGRMSATHVGMDLLSNRHVLTGLSFARSWGAMGYSDDREGQLAASFNTFHPYLYWQPHRRLSLWGIGGMGRGSVDLRDPRLAHVFNSEFRMWAGGLRSLLTKPGKNELGFRLDGFMSNIAIDPLEQIREVFGRASRARAMLEAVHQRGGRKRSFSLKSEIGGRLDRGEAVHGAAMEAGLRLGFIDTPTGLDLSLQGRMLLFHDGGYRDWGAGLQASWDAGNKRRGLRMSAASSHGQNGRAGATLWDHSYAYAFGQGRSLPGNPVPLNRIDSEAAYGVELLQGRGLLTPFSRLRWTGHGKELSVGSEFGLQPRSPDTNPLNMELEGIRGKSSRGPNMGVRIRMSIPF